MAVNNSRLMKVPTIDQVLNSGNEASHNMIFKALGTATVSSTTKNSYEQRFITSVWDTDDAVARTIEFVWRAEPTSIASPYARMWLRSVTDGGAEVNIGNFISNGNSVWYGNAAYNTYANFGTGSYFGNTGTTNDAGIVPWGDNINYFGRTGKNIFNFSVNGNRTLDPMLGAQTHPTIFIWSETLWTSATNEAGYMYHDTNDFYLATKKGDIHLNPYGSDGTNGYLGIKNAGVTEFNYPYSSSLVNATARTDTSNSSIIAGQFWVYGDEAYANSYEFAQGLIGGFTDAGASAPDQQTVYGVSGWNYFNATNSRSVNYSAVGLYGINEFGDACTNLTIAEATGAYAQAYANTYDQAGITITEAIGLNVHRPLDSGSNPVAVTNYYGIYMGDHSGFGSSINYALYSAGGDWYIADELELGGALVTGANRIKDVTEVAAATYEITGAEHIVSVRYSATGTAVIDVIEGLEIGTELVFIDGDSNAGTNNVTIQRKAGSSDTFITGTAANTSFLLDTNGAVKSIIKISSTEWKVM